MRLRLCSQYNNKVPLNPFHCEQNIPLLMYILIDINVKFVPLEGFLILAQLEPFLTNAILGNDTEEDAIAGVDVAFGSRNERVLDQSDSLL